MEDRDGKKPFIIPKTHTSTKEVLISEKPDSRNVIELFNDIKSCALEAQFDFRQNGCKSCDTIRNQKLQKLYNEKRIKMKKEQDPIERLAFHLITYRDVAVSVANDGLRCEQLSFSIEKYLGNPKDGIHLSRRPDVLLTSSGAQGLYRFGLLVCKVLLGKGYATIPSTANNQLPAQLHYDHHFCKIQSVNKEQRQIDDLLASSLIFCYEHENFEAIAHPPQILPIAILWYDLIERFPPELISTLNQESQHRNGKITNGGKSIKKKTSNLDKKTNSINLNNSIALNSGAWETPPAPLPPSQESTQNSTVIESPTTKYPSHFMVPYHRVYSVPILPSSLLTEPQQTTTPTTTTTQQIISSRDPRLLRTKRETSSETIPLSPQHLFTERSLSDGSIPKSSSDELVLITKSSSLIYIPLNSSTSLIDPRLKTLKSTRNIFYLELQAVKHALQQQKRLNQYYDSKSGLPPKTSYTLVSFLIRQVSINEYQRLLNDNNNTYKFTKHSNSIDCSSLHVSVIDCMNFGLVKSTKSNQSYIDLEQNENKLAFEQIEISNDLIQREKQLNSQQLRLRLREKRQRRIQQQINEKQNSKTSILSPSMTNSKFYITTGRQLLKEHQISSTRLPNTCLSSDLLDFLSREYKNENRPHVKHLLAELVGVFMEKYHINHNQTNKNRNSTEESTIDDQTMNSVIDMDLVSPSSQELCDHDERFRVPTPPLPPLPPPLTLPPLPPSNENIYTQSIPTLFRMNTLSNEPNKIFDDPTYNDRCQKIVEQLKERKKEIISSNLLLTTKSEAVIPTEETVFKACLGQFQSSSSSPSPSPSSINSPINNNLQEENNLLLPLTEDNSNRSRDEFVKLLTKEAFISKSSSPDKKSKNSKLSYERRRSHDDNDNNEKKISSNHSDSYQRYTRPSTKKNPRLKSPQKKISSNRTVLISNRPTISNDKETTEISTDSQNDLLEEQPKVKRSRIDSSSQAINSTDKIDNGLNQNDLDIKSIVTLATITDQHDYRRDLNEKRRVSSTNSSNISTIDNSKIRSSRSRSRSRSKSKDHHQRKSSTIKTSKIESNEKSQHHSRSSKDNQRRHQQKHNYEPKRSSDLLNRHHKQYTNQLPDRNELSFRNPFPYPPRNLDDFPLPTNMHQQRQPVRHKRFNYNHQSVADHPRFSSSHVLSTPSSLMDFNYPTSPPPPSHHHSISPGSIPDRNSVNSSYYRERSKSPTINYTNRYDTKVSNTFERLQSYLQNKTNETHEQSEKDYSSSSSSSINHDTSHWSSSKIKSDTNVQTNNQTLTYNDTEKLLNMVQRLRNQ